MFETRLYSSLVKVMQRTAPTEGMILNSATVLRGEVFSFQVAYRADHEDEIISVKPVSRLRDIQIRSVECVPVRSLGWAERDPDSLLKEPGLMPDILGDPPTPFIVPQHLWRSLWVTVRVPAKTTFRECEISLEFKTKENGTVWTEPLKLEILPAALPPQKLIHTEWFHTDCLASYYGVEVFSEEYWYLVETFLRNAVDHGINMVLTPVFTPPLDTQVGEERPTVQLVDVKVTESGYEFDFDKLARWIALARAAGIRHFEISHLATQWGAEKTPKIMADVNGEQKRIFGWDVRSDSPKYRKFLAAFLPELVDFLSVAGVAENCWFHTSDEPEGKHLESYCRIAELIRKYTPGFKHIDALSEVEFYEKGVVEIPVSCIDRTMNFIRAGVKNPWTYYCCCPANGYTSRFIHLPSAVTRALGIQLFRYGIAGFLHWGFNFYFSRLSRKPVDPFQVVDADYGFPDGDSFIVYPGPECEPLDSIRNELMREALQDQRALELLARLTSREEACAVLDRACGGTLTFTEFPRTESALCAVRSAVNDAIRDALK